MRSLSSPAGALFIGKPRDCLRQQKAEKSRDL